MKEKNKLIIAIVAVALIAVAVVGATYAFWTWTTNEAQRTSVSFTVTDAAEDVYANLDGGGSTTAQNLAPVACGNSKYTTYAIKKTMTLTYKNASVNPAPITGTLTITAWTPAHGTIPTAAYSHLHYAVTESGTNCSQTAVTGMSGTFPTSITAGTTKLIDDVTFLTAPANTNTEQSKTYYLWIWLDSTYEYENVGNAVTDPMQGLQFTVAWSGTINNTPA